MTKLYLILFHDDYPKTFEPLKNGIGKYFYYKDKKKSLRRKKCVLSACEYGNFP